MVPTLDRPRRPAGPPGRTGLALPLVGLGVLFVAGAGLARGGTAAYLTLACGAGALLLPLFRRIGWPALLAWVTITAVAYPFVRFPYRESVVTFDRVWIVGLMGLFLLPGGIRGGTPWTAPSRRLGLAIAWLLAAFGARAVFTGGDELTALGRWFDAIVLPAVLFAATRVLVVTEARVRNVLGALTVTGCVIAAVAVAQRILGFDLARSSGGAVRFDPAIDQIRVSGPYPGPEVLAVALLACLAATLGWVLLRGRPAYLLGAAAASLQVAAIGLTLFRAAWISALAVVVVVLGIRPRQTARGVGVAAVVGLVVFSAFLRFGDNPTVATRLNDTKNVNGRFATHEVALELFGRSPLVGAGVDQFYRASASVPGTYVGGTRSLRYPHSSYMGVLAEQGLFGFVPFVAVTVAAWWMVHVLRRRARSATDTVLAAAVAAGVLAYWFMSLSLTMLPYGPSNAFLALLLGAGAGRLDALEAEAPEQPAPEARVAAVSG